MPKRLARLLVQRIEDPVVRVDVEPAVGDRGRKLEQLARVERPDRPVRRQQLDPLGRAGMGRVETPQRPDDALRLRRRHRPLRRRGRRELDGGRALDVPLLVHSIGDQDSRGERYEHQHHGARDEPPLPQRPENSGGVRRDTRAGGWRLGRRSGKLVGKSGLYAGPSTGIRTSESARQPSGFWRSQWPFRHTVPRMHAGGRSGPDRLPRSTRARASGS